MHKEDSHLDLGTISIHNNVIASVAYIAACEIEGVKGIGSSLKNLLPAFLGKKLLNISVAMDKNSQVSLKIPLIIKYDYNIPDVANKVQENVRNAIERTANLSVKKIEILVKKVEKEAES